MEGGIRQYVVSLMPMHLPGQAMCICARSLIQQCLNFGAKFFRYGEAAGARSGRPPLLAGALSFAVYKYED